MDRNKALKEDHLVNKALYLSIASIQLGRGGLVGYQYMDSS
jgi:hypothetical protein